MNVAAVVALALASSACVVERLPVTCQDGRPVRVLVDAACPSGVCGYTCAPDRWAARPCQRAQDASSAAATCTSSGRSIARPAPRLPEGAAF